MPIEYLRLKDEPEPLTTCPKCRHSPFSSARFRGLVHSGWRQLFRLPYCCVICDECGNIVAHERPPKGDAELERSVQVFTRKPRIGDMLRRRTSIEEFGEAVAQAGGCRLPSDDDTDPVWRVWNRKG